MQIMGPCVQHTNPNHITFNSIVDVERLGRMVADGEGHLGNEGAVVSLTAMGGGQALPVVAFSSCKERIPTQQRRVLETVSNIKMGTWNVRILTRMLLTRT